MHTKASVLVALPTALLLALSLSACDEEVVTTTPTGSSSSSGAESSAPSQDEGSDGASTRPSSKASASSKPSSKASASSHASSSSDPNAKNVDINDLKAGDCVSEVSTSTRGSQEYVSDTTVVDCSTPHQYEMIGTGTPTATTYDEANTPEQIDEVCSPLLTKHVGSSEADKYSPVAATPTQKAWDQGDRSFVCFAKNADDSPLNNSIKNS